MLFIVVIVKVVDIDGNGIVNGSTVFVAERVSVGVSEMEVDSCVFVDVAKTEVDVEVDVVMPPVKVEFDDVLMVVLPETASSM